MIVFPEKEFSFLDFSSYALYAVLVRTFSL